MFAAKTSIRNYVCRRRTIHPRDVMSSSSASSVAAKAVSTSGQYNSRYISKKMSSSPMMMEASAEEESHFALILGKPGGGKGTISGKILQVRFYLLEWCTINDKEENKSVICVIIAYYLYRQCIPFLTFLSSFSFFFRAK